MGVEPVVGAQRPEDAGRVVGPELGAGEGELAVGEQVARIPRSIAPQTAAETDSPLAVSARRPRPRAPGRAQVARVLGRELDDHLDLAVGAEAGVHVDPHDAPRAARLAQGDLAQRARPSPPPRAPP